MSEEEKELAQSYAKIKGMSLSEAIKTVYFQAIEDDFDIALTDKALANYKKDQRTISLEELEKLLGI
jgi:hypothetical protein